MKTKSHHSKPVLSTSQRSFNLVRPRARFPIKLRTVLNDAAMEGNEHILSWLPHGKAFKVHKPDEFASGIMKRYFRQSHFRSFTRQLYHYGFERCEQGAFFHPLFQRDDETLSWSMGRKVKDDDEIHNMDVSTLTKIQASPSPMKQNNSDTIKGQQLHQQQQHMSSISLRNFEPLPLTFPNIYDSMSKSFHSVGDLVSSTQDAINLATELSVSLLEPRSIEQMRSDPLHIDDSFAELWSTED